MEAIQPFALAPWESRMQAVLSGQEGENEDQINELAKVEWVVRIVTSSSARNDLVGMGGTVRTPVSVARAGKIIKNFSVTLGMREEHNPYAAELAAIASRLNCLPEMKYRVVMILTSNRSAAQSIGNPRQQSGQGHIRRIYDAVGKLREDGNRVNLIGLPSGGELNIQKIAKMSARHATEPYVTPRIGAIKAKTTILSGTRAGLRNERKLQDGVGRYSKVDLALPGKHTRLLYNQLSWKEASVLAQLRTGMARLNGYLYQIRAAPSDEYPCGQAKETVEHFLFRCVKWIAQRKEMMSQYIEEKRGNLSFHLGGNAASDGQKWAPNMEAVRAMIRFAIAIGRLEQR
ncbi:hypothetical protein ACKAV7_011928 [Fusarium commune]